MASVHYPSPLSGSAAAVAEATRAALPVMRALS